MSDSVWPYRRQPTRLHRPWDSVGKHTGVGCHFLLQCMKVKSESEVSQSCPTLSDPMDCSLPGSSVHGIFQARLLEWGAIVFWKVRFRANQDSCNQASAESNPGRLSVRLIPKGVTVRENLKISLQRRSERCMPMDGTDGERKNFRKRNNTVQEMETHSWNFWSWISSWAMSHLWPLC